MSIHRLLGVCGALRAESTNRKLLAEAVRLYGPAHYEEADLRLPLYDGDDEAAYGLPEGAARLREAIAAADAVIISTPEYNKGPSGVLKNALDWASRGKPNVWLDKPVAVMSVAAGRAGGERAQSMLRQMMVPFRPRILQGPEMHLAKPDENFDAEGRLTSDLYVTTLTELMERLRAEVGRG
ncbi:MAG: NAD(P)H-dependent oxidoreductase [Rhodobacteraceae bacterium]|nr:NAD(P)H-dependent oxidoreductase [Paracoccaceae bacterium]